MNICHVWDAEYPWDVRVEKVSASLTTAGHDVHIVARNRDGRVPRETLAEGTVHRLPAWPVLGRRLDALAQFPAFFNPRWVGTVMKTARATKADLILVRDLPLAPTGIWAARRLGIPVVFDMAENYPAMCASLFENGVRKRSDYLVRNPGIVRRVEDWVIHNVDHTLVVVEESRDRLVAAGVPAERISVVCNTPVRARLEELQPRAHHAGESLELVYLGLLEVARGIAHLIDAVAECTRRGYDVKLTLIGKGREEPVFRARAAQHELGDAVRFLGHVPYQEAVRLLQRANVGVVPHLANNSWNSTIPNKLFDYMAAGLPVLSSNARPAARVVRETNAGLVYTDTNAHELAERLIVLSNVEQRAQLGASGRRAVEEQYNWEHDAGRLLAAVSRTQRRAG
jgi:glycosyltransferase involved in cell wall biosynthesis